MLDVYATARSSGWTDDEFVSLVHRLDESVAAVEDHGFAMTPLTDETALAEAAAVPRLWVKNDSGNV
ncbi:MAG: hypothetical protein GWN79_06760, partial [Actinobacteria bacterium]|nr:hypothetical protein [Actinomycetota bacterium]NIU18807.1 hypothetical protein [Actinomycetota bacterium]NIU67263.1 hypothetical protein [Actinomycetota bacterium]NIV86672.1 hypothetical protein [Actinomycetota bacterium]NIW29045.1 hypothetical protein [Actinomycetota bacterium]